MGKRRAASDQRLDELYREHPEGFVAARNELAKELREEGDRDGAGRLGKLRRPTAAAWLVNRVALDSPELVEEFAAATGALERAQRRALEGDEKAAGDLRAAAAREREAAAAVRDGAERAARDAGHPANSRALELVVETLRAASGDSELRERVQRGRLEREQSAAGLGLPEASSFRPRARSGRAAGASRAKRERKRLEEELADATARQERLQARVEEAMDGLRRDKARLAAGKRETRALARRLKAMKGET
ncbi:MAG TPA: hypothetical protein VH391_02945 [Solirubrobacterales bacterium]